MNISRIKPGSKAIINGFKSGNREYKQKLLSMGLVPGAILKINKLSSMTDIVEIAINNFSLILRLSEASIIDLIEVSM